MGWKSFVCTSVITLSGKRRGASRRPMYMGMRGVGPKEALVA